MAIENITVSPWGNAKYYREKSQYTIHRKIAIRSQTALTNTQMLMSCCWKYKLIKPSFKTASALATKDHPTVPNKFD